MIRLLLRLLNIKDFEVCASCETLKQQLEFVNSEKRELMETLIQLTKPAVVVPSEEVKTLIHVPQARARFSRNKPILEQMERKREEIVKNSPFIARVSDVQTESPKEITPESIASMEAKLGLDEEDASQVG